MSVYTNLFIQQITQIPENSPSSASEIGKGAFAESFGPKEDPGGEGCVIRGRITRDAWRDGPCRVWSPATSTWSQGYRVRWTRRALPALGSSPNLQPSLGSEKKPQNVLSSLNLNKACTSTIHTCTHLSRPASGNLVSGQHSRKGSRQGWPLVWQPFG